MHPRSKQASLGAIGLIAVTAIKDKTKLTAAMDLGRYLTSGEVQVDVPPGGWSFEYANTWYPDVDDTAAVVIGLVKQDAASRGAERVTRACAWMRSMQNRDGGWAAFDVENDRLFLNEIPFSDMDSLCDPSSPDVTGRVGSSRWMRLRRPMIAKSPRIVPGSASQGLVLPTILRTVSIASPFRWEPKHAWINSISRSNPVFSNTAHPRLFLARPKIPIRPLHKQPFYRRFFFYLRRWLSGNSRKTV